MKETTRVTAPVASNTLSVNVFTAPGKTMVGERPKPFGEALGFDPITSTLIFGEYDAVLVDAMGTVAEGEALAAWIALHNRNLETIYITHAHFDHFYGLSILLDRFPGARAIATPKTVNAMQMSFTPTVERLARRLFPGQVPTKLVPPQPYEHETFTLEGHELRIIEQGRTDSPDSTSLYVPSIGLIVAGDVVYNQCRMYVGDTTPESRKNWIAALDRLAAPDLSQGELRTLLATQKYRLSRASSNFYNADNTNPAAGDAAAIDVAQAIRVLVHSNEALLKQLLPDFEDRLIAFSPKLVKQVPDVQLSPGHFAQTRGIPQDVVIMANNRLKYDRKKMTPDIPRVPVRDWWNQPSWDSGANSISNREIVLGLANKDGGAHIDGSGYPNYRKAKEQGQLFFGQRMRNIGKMGHLAAIAGDQLKAFITETFGEEKNEVKETGEADGVHIGDMTITVYYKM